MQNGKTEGLNDEQNVKMMCENLQNENKTRERAGYEKANEAEKQTNLTQTEH